MATPLQGRMLSDAIAVYVYRRRGGELEFLQLLRSATTGEYQQSWQVVYGGIEAGETAVGAAIRELREETGLFPRGMFQVEYLEMFYFQHKDYVTVMPVFGVEVSVDDAITLNDEHTASRWIAAAEVAANFMWRSQREAIAVILETLANPGPALELLTVDLAKHRRG